jgi:hypothetical protein
MIPMDEQPPQVHREYMRELARKGVKAEVSVVERLIEDSVR